MYDIISVRVLCPLNTDSKYPEVTLQYAKAVLSQECLLKSQFQTFLFRRSVIIMLYLFGFFFFVVVYFVCVFFGVVFPLDPLQRVANRKWVGKFLLTSILFYRGF